MRFIRVEDILCSLHARSRTIPDLCFFVLGAYEEVKGIFDVGFSLLYAIVSYWVCKYC